MLFFPTWCPGGPCDPCATGTIFMAELHCSAGACSQTYVTGKSGAPRIRSLSLASGVSVVGSVSYWKFTYTDLTTWTGVFGFQPSRSASGAPISSNLKLSLTLNMAGPGFSGTYTGPDPALCPTPAGTYEVSLASTFTVSATISNGAFTNLIDEVNYTYPGVLDGLMGGFSYF